MNIALIKSYNHFPWRSPDTYQMIEESLSKIWPVYSIETSDPVELKTFLSNLSVQVGEGLFVFNIAEFLDEENKQGFLPALLDEWGLPYLGSGAKANETGLDKVRTKIRLEKNGIPTARYFAANETDSDLEEQAEKIGYPLIVKPAREGGHSGISEDSIVYDLTNLLKAVQHINTMYHQPALVEAYITSDGMREFSVGILDGDPRMVAPIEIDYDAMDVNEPILSFEAAQQDLERVKLIPDAQIRNHVVDLAERTFDAVGASDYSRVDLRMDDSKCYVLEINIMPGLGPHSFLPQAMNDIHELDYAELIKKLAADSIQRQRNGSQNTAAG